MKMAKPNFGTQLKIRINIVEKNRQMDKVVKMAD